MTINKEEIRKKIIDHLFWDARVDGAKISVGLDDGTVILSGESSTYLGRQAAEEDVWTVPGVTSVENNIVVKRISPDKFPEDEEIKAVILNILKWDPNIDHEDILVSVENGIVTVDGSVPAFWQKVRLEELVTEVNGVIALHNRMAVVPTKHYVDELIARDIAAAFDRNSLLDLNNIEIQVADGEVVLNGNVNSYSVFKTAEFIVKNTDGVTAIKNNLLIG